MDGTYNLPEDRVHRLFEPDLITPEQHRDRVQQERSDQPEIRLMLAILEDAVATYQRFAANESRQNQKLFRDAESWIQSSDTSWPYSFDNICEALKLEPEVMRRGLLRWKPAGPHVVGDHYRFPFRRVNGKRHSISIRDRSLQKSA